jgi:heterodisulfide reductase subunit A-like polyferredoxin
MVLGGGIGGMQAALDLAEGGIKVYLVEKEACLGGKMVQLDKTFPTNDCSMCTIAPRLVALARHLNVEVITNADVKSLEGEQGDFTVSLSQRARYIDESKCTGCGLCEAECPVKVSKEFDGNLSERKAIFRHYPQAVPGAFAVEKRGIAPCNNACPGWIKAQGYVALIAEGRFRDALDVVLREIPLPGVCGRVCPAFCEKECTRRTHDDPLAVRALKRFIADEADFTKDVAPLPTTREEKIAVIGAGPSGLTAAYHLRKKGYAVTVFEKSKAPGGMLRWGIPSYRLPEEILDREINATLALGIEFRSGAALGRDFTLDDLQKEGFAAVYIATGAPDSKRLGIEGENLAGVYPALTFLRSVKEGHPPAVGSRVVVIGGGNVAIDAARTAKRRGAHKVSLVCLESREEMPAWPREIKEALEERIALECSWGPVKLEGDGAVKSVSVRRCTSVFDENRRFSPKFEDRVTHEFAADTVIIAVGQDVDISPFGSWESFKGTMRDFIDKRSGATPIPNVFMGGDLARGPASAIEAMADGRRGAENIHRFLMGEPLIETRDPGEPVRAPIDTDAPVEPRIALPHEDLAKCTGDFREIEHKYTAEDAVREAARCLECGICSECRMCEKACEAGAMCHDEEPVRTRTLKVGAVILSPGFATFDPANNEEYGHGRWKNVLTGIQMERVLSASGPFQGRLLRPSDQKEPRRVAFLQCVGSREEGREHCSSVCCMYAIKQALLVKEHAPSVEVEIFFTDLRAFGKGFEAYYQRAKDLGVRFTRCRISALKQVPSTGDLRLQYCGDKGAVMERTFSMVVLSCGLAPPAGGAVLAEQFGLALDDSGFCRTEKFTPAETGRDGIYACGAFTGPKDISETVFSASAAASKALEQLWESRFTLIRTKQYPAERDVCEEPPRIGVFLCHCGKNIGGVLAMGELKAHAEKLPYVTHVEDNLYTCASDSLEKIKSVIQEKGLNRVVVASCTPRTHEALFQEVLRESGLNPFLFEMANIRDQCSWVHRDVPDKATRKAEDLVKMACAKAARLEMLQKVRIPVFPEALVLGGGITGMTTALSLARQGFRVHLVERERALGGSSDKVRLTEEGFPIGPYIEKIKYEIAASENIILYLASELEGVSGFVGSFQCSIRTQEGPRDVQCGSIVVATGGTELIPDEYLYGKDERVLTLSGMERRLAHDPLSLRSVEEVAFIQCVGSRCEERPYCSRICCTRAVKNALHLKRSNPGARVYVLYRDIRTFGKKEYLFKAAREAGVVFLRHEDDERPLLSVEDGALTLVTRDPLLDVEMTLHPDLMVLSTAIVPSPGAAGVSELLKVPLTTEGFFMEAHMKLRPVDFNSEGIFLAGLAQYPKLIEESILQAEAVAARVAGILSREYLEKGGIVAQVRQEKCVGCLTCVRSCPYGVPALRNGASGGRKAHIEAALCHGCGVCASECPCKAIELRHYTDEQVTAMVMGLTLEEVACE